MQIRRCSEMGRATVVLALAALCLAPAAADLSVQGNNVPSLQGNNDPSVQGINVPSLQGINVPSLQGINVDLQANLTEILQLPDLQFPVHQFVMPEMEPFESRGMGMLYNITPVVMDVVVKKQFLRKGFVTVQDGGVEVNVTWRQFLHHYVGPVGFVFCFVLFAMLLPIAGLLWCCCHMCHAKRRRRPFDRKHDACIKALLAILLIALLTMFLFGVVCSFATEQQLEEGLHKLPGGLRKWLRAARAFNNDTVQQVAQRLDKYRNFTSHGGFSSVLDGAMDLVSGQLEQVSNALAVESLDRIVGQLDGVQRDLREVQQLTATLRFQAGQLNAGLRKVKRNLLQTLANCDMPACVNLQRKHRIGELDTDIQYSQMLDKYFPTMPDVSELLNNVTALLDGHIAEEVSAGPRALAALHADLRRSLQQYEPDLHALFRDVGENIDKFVDKVRDICNKSNRVIDSFEKEIVRAEDYQQRYGPYRRYFGLGVAVALLSMTLALALGLLCGVCGKRPDVYGAADCCNKGKGSCCLYFGMVLVFVLGALCCLAAAGYFLAGALLQRGLCDPLTEPRNNSVFQVVDNFVDLKGKLLQQNANVSSDLSVSELLAKCYENHTIYSMLQLPRLVTLARLEAEVQLRARRLRPAYPARVVILRDGAKRKLRALADSGLSDFAFDRLVGALETNMTSLELPALARTLRRAADAAAERAGYGAVPAELRSAAAALDDLHHDVVTPMLRHTSTLNETAHRLRDSLRFNHTSLKQAVRQLLDDTQQAEDFLNEQGKQAVTDMMGMVTKQLAHTMVHLFHSVVDKEILGRCGPFSKAINGTRDSVCRNILLPINGFWVSVGYCVLLLLPLLLVSARLAQLYLQQDPYPGPLVEAEYLYDAYADRDNVPLANAYKADKRSQRAGRAACGAGACGAVTPRGAITPRGAGEAAALAPPLDAHHARRYNDMAPKHWEEGPPRYHGPATEYERPPPYYYPGPIDRQ